MTTKTKVIIVSGALIVSFAAGRYSVSSPDIHTIEDQKVTTDVEKNKDVHKKTTIEKEPDGKTVVTIEEDTLSSKKVDQDVQTHIDQTVTPSRSKVNISILAGAEMYGSIAPVWGLSANKEFIGPITIGAFGLNNGAVGLSIGVNF